MKPSIKRTLITLAGLLLAACHGGPPSGRELEGRLRVALRSWTPDPQSAQFRNIYRGKVIKGMANICGELSTKDTHGSYTGYRTFQAVWIEEPRAAPGKQELRVMLIDSDGRDDAKMICTIDRLVEERGQI
ncbi:hypothetical protein [Dyella sp. AtDHG13]|uniref:hypothetical protein n=1 Tax=Dyella sp. AtDHG13 TaxID=1938897 RepID=UPI0011B51AFC|nr:hypothetical protein [Dyella sp. AtDHG13]